jgi:glycosyltransferase involved in cell wall biosynthesis
MKLASGMRLMMTTDAVGGVWTFSVTLARALGVAGFEVHLVSIGPRPTDAQRAMLTGHGGVSLSETDLLLEWQDPAGADLRRAGPVFGAIADRFAPDLIHFNGFREATLDRRVPAIVVAHSCVNSWASACGELSAFGGSEWRAYTSNVRDGIRSADAWIAPTSSFRDFIAQHYNVPGMGFAIWNGVDVAAFGFESKRPVILSAGRAWDKAKNLSVLSSIAAKVDWPIRIAGSFRMNQSSSAVSIDGCDCVGEISHDELLREMEAASIFVSPALYEPFGLSVLEAARAGCALLLSDIPTFRELWEGAAMFFDPGDPKELKQSLRALCCDEAQRACLQRAAINRARRYSLQKTATRYRAIYESLLMTDGRRLALEREGGPA